MKYRSDLDSDPRNSQKFFCSPIQLQPQQRLQYQVQPAAQQSSFLGRRHRVSKRLSGRRKRRSSVAVAAEVVPKSDVPGRPRTRSLAKAVVWFPVMGKKARRSTESVRANDESIPVINLSSDDEKMEEEKVPATRALRSRIVGVCEGEEVKMAEKEVAVEVTATRTLRDRVVAAGEDEGTKMEKLFALL